MPCLASGHGGDGPGGDHRQGAVGVRAGASQDKPGFGRLGGRPVEGLELGDGGGQITGIQPRLGAGVFRFESQLNEHI